MFTCYLTGLHNVVCGASDHKFQEENITDYAFDHYELTKEQKNPQHYCRRPKNDDSEQQSPSLFFLAMVHFLLPVYNCDGSSQTP